MTLPPLDARPARALTDREVVKVLCGVAGGLLEFCDPVVVRRAVRWCAETDAFWAVLAEDAQPHSLFAVARKKTL